MLGCGINFFQSSFQGFANYPLPNTTVFTQNFIVLTPYVFSVGNALHNDKGPTTFSSRFTEGTSSVEVLDFVSLSGFCQFTRLYSLSRISHRLPHRFPKRNKKFSSMFNLLLLKCTVARKHQNILYLEVACI